MTLDSNGSREFVQGTFLLVFKFLENDLATLKGLSKSKS